MLIIGSHAAACWIYPFREPADIDMIATRQEVEEWADQRTQEIIYLVPSSAGRKMKAKMVDGTVIEFDVEENESDQILIENTPSVGSVKAYPGAWVFGSVPELWALWAIKRSHVHQPIHWKKNIEDMHEISKHLVGDMPGWVGDLLKARRREADMRVASKSPSLEMSNSDFFRQKRLAVDTYHPHDDYHRAVAYEDAPLFTKMKRDHTSARCERDMFEAMTLEQRQRCVREETMVIALERYIVPGRTTDQDQAYASALERVCTTLTSGWFRDFAIESYPDVKDRDVDFVSLWDARIKA